MKTAAVAQLKARLSSYLRQVRAGEEVLVTERGLPIARIVPVGELDKDLESLRDLEQQGLIHLGSGRIPNGFWSLARSRDPKARVRAALIQERKEGR